VREDAQILYGFRSLAERQMFRTLIDVSGVGPRIALSVLSVASPGDIIRAVKQNDHGALRAPGVGPKLTKRLVQELQSKFEELSTGEMSVAKAPSVRGDIASALQQLGYSQAEIEKAIMEADIGDLGAEQALKKVLRLLQR
jgi:Holliday junction DNA helicase RuvA